MPRLELVSEFLQTLAQDLGGSCNLLGLLLVLDEQLQLLALAQVGPSSQKQSAYLSNGFCATDFSSSRICFADLPSFWAGVE